jgi:hypothetical protein
MSSLGMSAAGRSPWSARDGWCLWPCLVPCPHQHKPGRTGTAPAWRPATTLPLELDQLFISYSHVDRGWVERLQMRNLTPAYYNQTVSESQTVAMDIAADLN